MRHVEGADADSEIGAATEVLQHAADAPAVLFEKVPGYDEGMRVLVNGLGTVDRMALALGAPTGLTKVGLSQVWRDQLTSLLPRSPITVTDGPVMENVVRGDDVDLTIFPAPQWHPEDGGRYIGTGSYDVTRDPDEE